MTAAVRTGLVQGTPEWEAARPDSIGSSDAPVIAGESPYKAPLELWAEMRRLVVPEHDEATRALFRIGHLMEPVLLQLYTEQTGRRVQRVRQSLRHPARPWMTASLDARVVGQPAIVEGKWTHARRWSDGEAVPADVLVQVQHAMCVSGAERADVVALVGPSLRIVEVPRDDAMIADLVALEEDFWRHVQDGTQPPTDGSESTRRALARIHPRDDGTLIPASPDLLALVEGLRAAKADAKSAADREATASNALRALIGDASGIEGLCTYRKNADSARVNWPAVASAYRELLSGSLAQAELDGLVAVHTATAEGPRVLRLVKEKP